MKRIRLYFFVNDEEFEHIIMSKVKSKIRHLTSNCNSINTGSTGVIDNRCSMYYLVPFDKLEEFLNVISIPFSFKVNKWIRVQTNTLSYYFCNETLSFKLKKKTKNFSVEVYSNSY
tara:strand:+ start:1067 stop:1414 length:348 start_codon:yes stop_codon:yes gene_type:complete